MYSWFLATAGAAIIWAAISIVAKKLMQSTSGLAYTYLYSVIGLAFYTPVFIYFVFKGTANFTNMALIALAVSGLANIGGFLLNNYSIKLGELSTVIPFTKLNPVFTGIFAAVILAETITAYNAAGIGLVTVGSYVVLKDEKQGYMEPIKKFKARDGPKLAAASAIVFSIAAVADRFATQTISPKIYTYLIYLFMTAGLTLYIAAKERQVFKEAKNDFLQSKTMYTMTGLGAAISSYLIFYSFSKAEASAVIPVLQLQVFISVIAGTTLFNEKHLKEKMIGSVILLAGVTLTTI